MSASPAGNTPGAGPNGSAGRPPPRRLAPPRPSNPLVQRKPKRPSGVRPAASSSVSKTTNAGLASRPHASSKTHIGARPPKPASFKLEDRPFGDTQPSLFEKPPPVGAYTDYPVYTTKKAFLEGLRLHVARLASNKSLDIRDESQFTRPLYLLRKDIKTVPQEIKPDNVKPEDTKPDTTEEDAEREAAKAAARAEIAPSQGGTKPRQKQPTKKTQQVFMKEQTETQVYRSQLKYEEALPWHLEDDDKKQVWMGTYEEMSSQTWAQIRFENRDERTVAVLTPLEKWYKFTPKSRVDQGVLEQWEKDQEKIKKEASAEPEFMKAFDRAVKKEEDERDDYMLARGRFHIAKGKNDGIGTKYDEELDFNEDFADDEAPPEIEGEEDDIKDIESRIKKDQLKSNVFDMVGKDEYEDEDTKERREKEYRKKVGRKTKKALMKREHNAIYESDEENQYADESDSTDTEEEILREKEKKEAEAKTAAAAPATGAKPGSAASSRNNTPGHRSAKHPEPLNKVAVAAGLKRSGSPGLSDASGNESSAQRKKQKKGKLPSSRLATGSNPPSRPRSPANGVAGRPGIAARGSFAGSGSDTDTPISKLKRAQYATGGRSPSPTNGATPGASRIGSRAASPAAVATAGSLTPPHSASAGGAAPAQRYTSVPSQEILKGLIPPQGLTVKDLSKFFNLTAEGRAALREKLKGISVYDKETKLLKPLQ